jgi:hypothetical protein
MMEGIKWLVNNLQASASLRALRGEEFLTAEESEERGG